MLKTLELPNGTTIKYRVPNVIEQLRFFGNSKWYSEDSIKDYWLRMSRGLEAAQEFIHSVEGAAECFADVLEDRSNLDCLVELVQDVAGIIRKVSEEEKKL